MQKETAKGEEKSLDDIDKEIRYKSYAVISMVGDFMHNFTDGLSIGVAYVASKFSLVSLNAVYRLQDGSCHNYGYVLP